MRTPQKTKGRKHKDAALGKKIKGHTPEWEKRRRLEFGSGPNDSIRDVLTDDYHCSSSGSTVFLDKSQFRSSTPESEEQVDGNEACK